MSAVIPTLVTVTISLLPNMIAAQQLPKFVMPSTEHFDSQMSHFVSNIIIN